MTREEKCKLFIERGYTYDPENGNIYNKLGKALNATHSQGYVCMGTDLNKKTIKLRGHHFAWYYIYDNCNINQIDHINGVTHDNRIVNLRNVTPNQNQWNRTRAKGYCFYKNSNKWKAQIQLNNKNTHLGYFNTEQEARNAYLAAKEIYHKF